MNTTSYSSRTLIAIFAKPPRPGEVKTRLIPELGAEGAAHLAAAFLRDVLRVVLRLDWARVVVATTGPFDGVEESVSSVLHDVPLWNQGQGDLGARMERILARGLAEGAPAAIALGADSPGLGAVHLQAAHDALQIHPAVLGPTSDGGYYLIGLKRCPRGLLDNLPWSARETYRASELRLRQMSLSPVRIISFFDVDEPADLKRLVRQIQTGEIQAPATAAALSSLGVLESC